MRTRAYGIVVNTIAAASKLTERELTNDLSMVSEADLKHAATTIFREEPGITDAMRDDLRIVCGAWPELPAEMRQSIVAAVKSFEAREQIEETAQ